MKTIRRQIYIYQYIRDSYYHGPTELRNKFGIGTRMLQRDLKDLRDCGLLYLKYNKKNDNYDRVDPPTHKPVIKMTERRKNTLQGCTVWGHLYMDLPEPRCTSWNVMNQNMMNIFLVGPEMDLDEERHWKNPRKKS